MRKHASFGSGRADIQIVLHAFDPFDLAGQIRGPRFPFRLFHRPHERDDSRFRRDQNVGESSELITGQFGFHFLGDGAVAFGIHQGRPGGQRTACEDHAQRAGNGPRSGENPDESGKAGHEMERETD